VTAPTATPTFAEQREQLKAELAQLQRQLHDGVDGALDRDDAAGALRFERRQAPTIKARIAELTTQLAGVDREIAEVGRIARETALAEQLRTALADAHEDYDRDRAAMERAATEFGVTVGQLRLASERVAQAEAELSRDPAVYRLALLRASATAVEWVEAHGQALATWLGREPGAELPDRAFLVRITSPRGAALVAAYDAFYGEEQPK